MSEAKFKVKFGKTQHRQTSPKPVPGFAATEDSSTPAPERNTAQPRRVSRTARLLALAYYVERQIDAGAIKDYAEAARILGMSRARMSQVMALLGLPTRVREAILSGEMADSERLLRQHESQI
jgi:hypothetical protein